jgi:hypothetical protein
MRSFSRMTEKHWSTVLVLLRLPQLKSQAPTVEGVRSILDAEMS